MTLHLILAVAALLLVILDIVLPRLNYALHAAVLCLALALIL
jgi:hypothetical protein